jgi:hypothetical protein
MPYWPLRLLFNTGGAGAIVPVEERPVNVGNVNVGSVNVGNHQTYRLPHRVSQMNKALKW